MKRCLSKLNSYPVLSLVMTSDHQGPNMKYPHTAIIPAITTRIVKRNMHPIGQQQNARLHPILAKIRAPTKKKIHFVQSGTTVELSASTRGKEVTARIARKLGRLILIP